MDFHKLFYQSLQPMWFISIDSLRFLEVNDAAIVQYGYSREEFALMTIADIRPKEDWSLVLESLKLHGDRCHERPFRHIRRDGSLIDVQVIRYEMTYNGQKAFLIIPVQIIQSGAYVSDLELLISRLQFKVLQQLTHDRERFNTIKALTAELNAECLTSKQIALVSRIRALASGDYLN